MRKLLPIFIFITAWFIFEKTAFAFNLDPEKFKFSGYYKNIFVNSKTRASDDNFFMDTNRLRLELNSELTDSLSAFISYDNNFIFHDIQNASEFDLVRQNNQDNFAFLDTDKKISDKKHFYWADGLYRAYLKYQNPKLRWTLGKQAIDWSRMRMYHPLDFFNPISPLDIEKDEKLGIDALYVDYFLQDFATLSAIYVLGKNSSKNGYGLKLSKKIKDYDYALIATRYKKDNILGASFDGYIKDAGFRGEMTYTKKANGKRFPRVALGIDRNFTSKLYALCEYFYNGGAEKDTDQFLSSYDFSKEAITMRRNILGAGFEYAFSGVTKLANYVFYDFDGKSVFYNPELRYNFKTNLDLSFGVQLFWGSSSSEYGSYNDLYYAQAKYYF